MMAGAVAFAGERQGGTGGAYYPHARRYDPHTGRFTQPDPLGYAGGPNLTAFATLADSTRPDPRMGIGP